LEPNFLVIGLNHRTAATAMRERFWISEARRYEALRELGQSEGIEEVVVLANENRTEFLLWAAEPTLAANSLLHFLTLQHGLRLSEWEHFYRLLDEAAFIHIFRVAAGLDAMALGEPQIITQVKAAWQQARTVGVSGLFLDAILERALSVAQQANLEMAAKDLSSIPRAAVQIARRIFDSLEGRRVLLLGTGENSELAARSLTEIGASVSVIDQSLEQAQDLAQKLGGTAASLEERWQCMLKADIVICCSGCPHVILSQAEAERIASERNRAPLVILDIAMPRDVDPDVRRVDGILLCDLDGLERVAKQNAAGSAAGAAEAEKFVLTEAQAFRRKLQAAGVVPTIVALRRRLDEICRQELESFTEERGPFTREQDQALHAIAAQVIRKIAGSLAHELKGLQEEAEQKQMTAAVHRLFHLETLQPALAGATSERNAYEQQNRIVATL
jgi:glutamyl-tRNA reductase